MYGTEGKVEQKLITIRNLAKSALLKMEKGDCDTKFLKRQFLLIDKVADGVIEIGRHVGKEVKEKFQDLDKELMRHI